MIHLFRRPAIERWVMRPSATHLAASVVLCICGCGDSSDAPLKTKTPSVVEKKPVPTGLAAKIDDALAAASRFLIAAQSADGAWRSEVYATHKDGPSLAPLVAEALGSINDEASEAARAKAAAYLAAMVQADGTIHPGPSGWTYAVYTSAMSVVVLSRDEHREHIKARDRWLAFLRQHQFNEALGWRAGEVFYGGWGYADEPPRKLPDQMIPRLYEPNISATIFALEGLRAAGVSANDPAVSAALDFVQRCQNYRQSSADAKLDDGGFFFVPDDTDRNKAGVAGDAEESGGKTPSAGKSSLRFRSYGSTTADGLRCLLACGLAQDHPRVAAARQWLTAHFSVQQAPGAFDKEREHMRKALYYYYCNSAARALAASGVAEVGAEKARASWASLLAEHLLKQQAADGSWKNEVAEMREDDPLIATTFVVAALAHCRKALDQPESNR